MGKGIYNTNMFGRTLPPMDRAEDIFGKRDAQRPSADTINSIPGESLHTPEDVARGRLPTSAAERKAIPVFSGFVNYFPLAMAAVAELSKKGNDQHNPGKPLHWDRSKSGDEKDALMRHLLEAGTIDSDGIRHSAKVAWRAMANLEKELEAEKCR